MTYKFLDSTALPDHKAWHSTHIRRVRDNLQHVADTRLNEFAVSFATLDDTARRLASVENAAWGPWPIRVNESVRRVYLEVRLEGIENTVVNFAMTLQSHGSGRFTEPPPQSNISLTSPVPLNHWFASSSSVEKTVLLSASVPSGYAPGVIWIYLWTRSSIDMGGEPETSGDTSSARYGGLDLGSGISPNPVLGERVILEHYDPLSKGVPQEYAQLSEVLHICAYDGGAEIAYTVPPPVHTTFSETSQWEIRPLGVAVVSGLRWYQDNEIEFPSVEAFGNGVPVKEAAYLSMLTSMQKLTTGRVPQYSALPDWGQSDSENRQRYWFWRSNSSAQQPALDEDWKTIHAAPFVARLPSHNGLVFAVAMRVFGKMPAGTTSDNLYWEPTLLLRWNFLDFDGTSLSTTTQVERPVKMERLRMDFQLYGGADYDSMQHMDMVRDRLEDEWWYQGGFVDWPYGTGNIQRRIQLYTIEADEADLPDAETFPYAYATIEAQLVSDASTEPPVNNLWVMGAGVFARALTVPDGN